MDIRVVINWVLLFVFVVLGIKTILFIKEIENLEAEIAYCYGKNTMSKVDTIFKTDTFYITKYSKSRTIIIHDTTKIYVKTNNTDSLFRNKLYNTILTSSSNFSNSNLNIYYKGIIDSLSYDFKESVQTIQKEIKVKEIVYRQPKKHTIATGIIYNTFTRDFNVVGTYKYTNFEGLIGIEPRSKNISVGFKMDIWHW